MTLIRTDNLHADRAHAPVADHVHAIIHIIATARLDADLILPDRTA
jgi:hypothetical protein